MRPAAWLRVLLLSAGLWASSGAAVAGLFDDEEARKAIVDLRARITAVEEQGRSRTGDLQTQNAQLTEQITALRRSLVELNNQLEAVRGELATLRGSQEQLARELANIQSRQKDVGQALDERLRRLEPMKMSVDGREVQVQADEKRAYDEAVGAIRDGEFDRATSLLASFQRRFPGTALAESARFWQGNALYGKRDYKEAINVFRSFVAAWPEHPRAPEALLALANSQAEMKDPKAARRTIDELMKVYPRSEAAQAGKERLASLK